MQQEQEQELFHPTPAEALANMPPRPPFPSHKKGAASPPQIPGVKPVPMKPPRRDVAPHESLVQTIPVDCCCICNGLIFTNQNYSLVPDLKFKTPTMFRLQKAHDGCLGEALDHAATLNSKCEMLERQIIKLQTRVLTLERRLESGEEEHRYSEVLNEHLMAEYNRLTGDPLPPAPANPIIIQDD